jgi:hypothetical protein
MFVPGVMAIIFALSPKQYVMMLTKVSAQSYAFDTLKKATSSTDARPESICFSISCSQMEAELFLKIAKQYCPAAVGAIERAIKIPKAH